jgi:3-deoxy-manno-octulosonate cytidylyltransferase (CMP-KDO synthetase)
MVSPRFRVVIPARFGSSRLPAKPLLAIAGRPMIQHVWARALEAGADDVLVATDDERIARAVEGFGGRAMLTSPDHASGTDRLAEVAAREGWSDDTIVVNLQGDEPQLPGALLTRLAGALHEHPEASASTLAGPITHAADVWNSNVVKVVLDARGFALYFSRAPIPWVRASYRHGEAHLAEDVPVLRHLGLYGYRVGTLLRLARTAPPALERAESLEQLRILHLGLKLHVSVLDEVPAHGVDTAEDLERVRELLESRPA